MLIAKWKKQGYEKVRAPPCRRRRELTSGPALLSSLRSDQRDQLQLDLHLPRAQGPAQGGSDHRVRQLWLQGLRVE